MYSNQVLRRMKFPAQAQRLILALLFFPRYSPGVWMSKEGERHEQPDPALALDADTGTTS